MDNDFKLNFIGVGAPKCGTTWISRCLAEHPQICHSQPKELNFFNKQYPNLDKNPEWNYIKGIEWYKKYFISCKKTQIKGEFCTNYLNDPEAPKLIHKHFPNIKILICLRNPANRIYSEFMHIKYNPKYNIQSFEKFIFNNSKYIARSFYYEQIQNYLKYFDRNQIYIMIFEDIAKNPSSFIKNLYNFLNIDSNFIPDSLNKIIGKTSTYKNPSLYKFLKIKKHIINSRLKKIYKKIIISKKINEIIIYIFFKLPHKTLILINKNKKKSSLRPETKNKLNKLYEPHNKKLEKLINRDLSFWN